MVMKDKQDTKSKDTITTPLDRVARVLAEAKGEAPRALVRMPDKAIEETEKRKRLIKKLQGLDIDEKRKMAKDPNTAAALKKLQEDVKKMGKLFLLEKEWESKHAIKYAEARRYKGTPVEILERLSRQEGPK